MWFLQHRMRAAGQSQSPAADEIIGSSSGAKRGAPASDELPTHHAQPASHAARDHAVARSTAQQRVGLWGMARSLFQKPFTPGLVQETPGRRADAWPPRRARPTHGIPACGHRFNPSDALSQMINLTAASALLPSHAPVAPILPPLLATRHDTQPALPCPQPSPTAAQGPA